MMRHGQQWNAAARPCTMGRRSTGGCDPSAMSPHLRMVAVLLARVVRHLRQGCLRPGLAGHVLRRPVIDDAASPRVPHDALSPVLARPLPSERRWYVAGPHHDARGFRPRQFGMRTYTIHELRLDQPVRPAVLGVGHLIARLLTDELNRSSTHLHSLPCMASAHKPNNYKTTPRKRQPRRGPSRERKIIDLSYAPVRERPPRTQGSSREGSGRDVVVF